MRTTVMPNLTTGDSGQGIPPLAEPAPQGPDILTLQTAERAESIPAS